MLQKIGNMQRTYWLISTIATSSRSVNFLKASSMACVGVSSVTMEFEIRVVRKALVHGQARMYKRQGMVCIDEENRKDNAWRLAGTSARGVSNGAEDERRTRIDNKVVGAQRRLVVSNAGEKEAGSSILIANDCDEVATVTGFDCSLGGHVAEGGSRCREGGGRAEQGVSLFRRPGRGWSDKAIQTTVCRNVAHHTHHPLLACCSRTTVTIDWLYLFHADTVNLILRELLLFTSTPLPFSCNKRSFPHELLRQFYCLLPASTA